MDEESAAICDGCGCDASDANDDWQVLGASPLKVINEIAVGTLWHYLCPVCIDTRATMSAEEAKQRIIHYQNRIAFLQGKQLPDPNCPTRQIYEDVL